MQIFVQFILILTFLFMLLTIVRNSDILFIMILFEYLYPIEIVQIHTGYMEPYLLPKQHCNIMVYTARNTRNPCTYSGYFCFICSGGEYMRKQEAYKCLPCIIIHPTVGLHGDQDSYTVHFQACTLAGSSRHMYSICHVFIDSATIVYVGIG